LRGLFEKPLAWKILDAVIALVMWAIAASLLFGR
jgi:L-lysine exporter family protein LysE/ArgO